ncbi:hypothetical protein [Methylocella sp.]|uniref:hypothetical protein n=1 Tax=Methylocella sp. TaxID=1978226 RepID=UPI003784175B
MAVRIFAALALLGLIVAAPAGARAQGLFSEFAEGPCGAPYVGQDRDNYPCGKTRKPVCQRDTGRCQCLERRECGAKQDEGW